MAGGGVSWISWVAGLAGEPRSVISGVGGLAYRQRSKVSSWWDVKLEGLAERL